MIKVLLADDHALVRAGLKQVLSNAGDMIVDGEAGNGAEVLEHIHNQEWDVVVLDMNMPGLSGIDLIKRIRQEKPQLHILVLSMHDEDQFAVRTLKAGAAGYVTKGSAPQVLISAIRRVASGGRHISRDLAERLVSDPGLSSGKPLHEQLSDREYQVLRLLASGMNMNLIAKELCLSPKTVSTHKYRLMRKLNVTSNTELMRYTWTEELFQ